MGSSLAAIDAPDAAVAMFTGDAKILVAPSSSAG